MVRQATARLSRLLLPALLIVGAAGWTARPLAADVADAAPIAQQDTGSQEAIQGVTGPDRTLSVEEPFGIRLPKLIPLLRKDFRS